MKQGTSIFPLFDKRLNILYQNHKNRLGVNAYGEVPLSVCFHKFENGEVEETKRRQNSTKMRNIRPKLKRNLYLKQFHIV